MKFPGIVRSLPGPNKAPLTAQSRLQDPTSAQMAMLALRGEPREHGVCEECNKAGEGYPKEATPSVAHLSRTLPRAPRTRQIYKQLLPATSCGAFPARPWPRAHHRTSLF